MGKKIFLLLAMAAMFAASSFASKLGAKGYNTCYEEFEPNSDIPADALLEKKETPVLYYDNEGFDLQTLRQANRYKVTGVVAWIFGPKTFSKGYVINRKSKGTYKDIRDLAKLHKQKYAFISSELDENEKGTYRIYLLRPYTEAEISRWRLGIEARNLDESERRRHSKTGGTRVTVTFDGFPALRAGIRRGDIITQLNGTDIKTVADLSKFEKTVSSGDVVSVHLIRNAKKMQIDVRL